LRNSPHSGVAAVLDLLLPACAVWSIAMLGHQALKAELAAFAE
jgi:hypothetical protein